ncbi:hypothetical protein DCS_07222 [Drechmeria coniospora]|uniref:Uncharacterized protein n=1 Tax=Drechmeria coniospora TaxID=98403 RepID=A0A151GDT1_DRECN|nr:hypothetical protein DCS_07222 [Drechmeria coniospora]KYK55259.1 hypothetical protein DCS_07222 [Drechmeria coniospora]
MLDGWTCNDTLSSKDGVRVLRRPRLGLDLGAIVIAGVGGGVVRLALLSGLGGKGISKRPAQERDDEAKVEAKRGHDSSNSRSRTCMHACPDEALGAEPTLVMMSLRAMEPAPELAPACPPAAACWPVLSVGEWMQGETGGERVWGDYGVMIRADPRAYASTSTSRAPACTVQAEVQAEV